MTKQPIEYLPHVEPFSIVEIDEKKLVVLSNDKSRLRLYDPDTSIEYPYKEGATYMIAGPRYCVELVMRKRLWLKSGDFSIAPENCTSEEALIKLAWYYMNQSVPPQFPTMYYSTVDHVLKPVYGDGQVAFFDTGYTTHDRLMTSLWSMYVVNHQGITTHEEALPHRDEFKRRFTELCSSSNGFSLPLHNACSLQEHTLVLYNGEVGYLTDYAAPPRLIVPKPGHGRSQIPVLPQANVHVLMTPSQCAHTILRFGLLD